MSLYYPLMGYSPELLHCAYTFGNFVSLGDFDDDPSLPLQERTARQRYFFGSLTTKFPRHLSSSSNRYAERLLHLQSGLSYRYTDSGLIITSPDAPFCPTLGFRVETGFLTYELHNCATAPLAALMYSHGLQALRDVHKAYGLPHAFLPSITFTEEGMSCVIPHGNPEKFTYAKGIEKAIALFLTSTIEAKRKLVSPSQAPEQ